MLETERPAAPAASDGVPAYARDGAAVVATLRSDAASGLSSTEAASRLAEHGPNQITSEKPPSIWAIGLQQLRDPMNLMLVGVAVISLFIDQVSTSILVGCLVVLNVLLGVRQELQAQASVDALSKMQVPVTKVVRDGGVSQVPATDVVPGDIVNVEAGDIVPADGRILRSATLETQEAALTGESAPVGKDAATLASSEVSIGDRSNMLFQNTSVTRGTASMVVTETAMDTQMGQIATMLTKVTRTRSPLQKELDKLTGVIGVIAWTTVAVIIVVGLLRGLSAEDVLLLGTAMAISAIPTGLPTFVSAMLSYGAKQLAEAKAVVKNLTDVETLGATSAINTDKTGTLTMNQMMVSALFVGETWYTVEGAGYQKSGAILAAAGGPAPDFSRLGLGLVLDSDATVADDGTVVGDPTEAALIVLAAKVGVDAEETRRTYPRVAEVPFDSDYKFMATFHDVQVDGRDCLIELVKGAPDVVLDRCNSEGSALAGNLVPIAKRRAGIEEANARMGGKGLRVLAFATRLLDASERDAVIADPMAFASDLAFAGMVGIIDPLRPEAKHAVDVALRAGIDVRMITGDHAVTAQAIGENLGLGAGAISGAELRQLTDEQLIEQLPNLHVFGRVAPDDKLRLARVMQSQGEIVAMTGDAVNDAAALKQADIGVAMGSGSEVSKQAARMVLTDDNFGTLVHAVELGRTIYAKVVSYIRYQMSQLIGLILLFLAATVFNINDGMALTPLMVLFINFFIAIFPVIVILLDPGDPDVMKRPPRDPKVPITNRAAVTRWVMYGAVLFIASFVPLVAGPDDVHVDQPSASMTMTFAVMSLGTILSGLVMRRDPTSGLVPPLLTAVKVLVAPLGLLVLATELAFLQRALLTQSLTGLQWLASVGLALTVPVVVEADKWVRRRHVEARPPLEPVTTVTPTRALATAPS